MPVWSKHGGSSIFRSYSSQLWFHEFQRSNYGIEDAACSGRPRTAVNDKTIGVVRAIIENDPHSTYEQIEDILGIGSSAVDSIVHDYLKLRNVCAR